MTSEGAWTERTGRVAPPGYRVTLEPPDPAVAGQDGTWTLAIAVGGEGILPGGSVEVIPPMRERQR